MIHTTSGKLLKRFRGVMDGNISWFPDSSRLIVGNQILEDFDWNAEDSLIEQPKSIEYIRVFPEGTRAAIVLADSNQIQVIDSRGTVQSCFDQHSEPVKHLNISEDNETIASIDKSGVIYIWSSNDGSTITRWSNLAEGEAAEIDRFAPVVFLSPDKQYCAASLNGKTMAWRLGEPFPIYTHELKGSRVIGWSEAPLALQIYTGFEKPSEPIRQRQAIQFPQVEKHDYMVSWEPEKSVEHRYTLSTDRLVQEPKDPQWITRASYTRSTGNLNVDAGMFISGNEINIISLESHSRHVDVLSSSVYVREGIRPYGFGTNKFVHFTSNGYLRLWESGEKLFWSFPTKYSPKSLLSYSAGRLWIADGKQIHVLNGALRPLSEREESPWKKWRLENSQMAPIFLGAFLLVIPVWLFLDRGIRISHTAKWLLTALSISLGIALVQKAHATIQPSPLFLSVVLILNLLIGIGIAAILLEPLRMLSVGKWKMPLLVALSIASIIFVKIVYNLWPKPWALESKQTLIESVLLNPTIVLTFVTLGFSILSLRLIRLRRTPNVVNVPTWVRVGMWQTGSMFELSSGAVSGLAAGIGTVILLNQLHVFPLPNESQLFLKIFLITVGPFFFAAGCYELFVAIWLMRNGGWSAHVINELDSNPKGEASRIDEM